MIFSFAEDKGKKSKFAKPYFSYEALALLRRGSVGIVRIFVYLF